jgi:hypothetical protein
MIATAIGSVMKLVAYAAGKALDRLATSMNSPRSRSRRRRCGRLSGFMEPRKPVTVPLMIMKLGDAIMLTTTSHSDERIPLGAR